MAGDRDHPRNPHQRLFYKPSILFNLLLLDMSPTKIVLQTNKDHPDLAPCISEAIFT